MFPLKDRFGACPEAQMTCHDRLIEKSSDLAESFCSTAASLMFGGCCLRQFQKLLQ
jgi:hypothetical protein